LGCGDVRTNRPAYVALKLGKRRTPTKCDANKRRPVKQQKDPPPRRIGPFGIVPEGIFKPINTKKMTTGDKNWLKIMRLKDADVLVKKDHEPSESQGDDSYKVDIVVSVDGCLNQIRFGFENAEAQDRAFKAIDTAEAEKMYQNIIQYHQ
jgi:hypothetical protein